MNRRRLLAVAASLSTAGCLGTLLGDESAEPRRRRTTATPTTSIVPEPEEDVRIVLVEVQEDGPVLEGVAVNFTDDRVNVDVTATFYREVDGVREILSTREQTLYGLSSKEGDRFSIPFPTDDGPEDGVRFELSAAVSGVV